MMPLRRHGSAEDVDEMKPRWLHCDDFAVCKTEQPPQTLTC